MTRQNVKINCCCKMTQISKVQEIPHIYFLNILTRIIKLSLKCFPHKECHRIRKRLEPARVKHILCVKVDFRSLTVHL